ncbi:MAG: signal peptidase I [Bacillota bacterium]|nr:signal peptidase I [Bacillota bacterium]
MENMPQNYEDVKKQHTIDSESIKQNKIENNNNNETEFKPGFISRNVFEWVHAVITSVIIVIILLTFVFRMVNVDGRSMMDTLQTNDKVVVTNLFYYPHDGDIIVISHGANYTKPLIKRVIAVEGQTLNIDFKTGTVIVDGVKLYEPYIKAPTTTQGDLPVCSVVPKGKVFVMGDNRPESMDSRYSEVGLINISDIIGKAQYIVYPFDRFRNIYN